MTYGDVANETKLKGAMLLLLRVGIFPDQQAFRFLIKFFDGLNRTQIKFVDNAHLFNFFVECTGCSRSRLERSLRYSITCAYNTNKLFEFNKILGKEGIVADKLTVMQFLNLLVMCHTYFI